MKRLFPLVWLLILMNLMILVPTVESSDDDMVYCCLRGCT